jgi:penicillin-binding protein 1A
VLPKKVLVRDYELKEAVLVTIVGPVIPYMFENPIAGKTGTTQNQSDGWFMGMVPNLVTGVWVGCEDRSARFKSITYGQGATAALPVWGFL